MSELESKRPNVIVIVVDTLRYDRGAALGKTLDGAVDYGWAVTPAPWTLPAHVSLLTGLYPSIHETHERVEMRSLIDFAKLRNDKTTLMTRLKKLGYTTYGFSANSFISSAFGFEGFDVLKNWQVPWADIFFEMDEVSAKKFAQFFRTRHVTDFFSPLFRVLRKNPRLFLSTVYASLATGTDRVFRKWPQNKGLNSLIRFVKKTNFKEPFFLFLNILEVHEPYFKQDHLIEGGFAVRAVSSVSKEDFNLWTEGYDAQVELLSKKLPKLFDAMKQKGIFDNTLIILTSDHGQLLGEFGWIGHGVFLYDELVKVPLFVKYPSGLGVDRMKDGGLISLANVPNFIFDIAQGQGSDSSLFSPHVFSESWFHKPRTPGRIICTFSPEGKVIYNFKTESVEEAHINDEQDKRSVDELVGKCLKFAELNKKLDEITSSEKKLSSQ